jgi:NADP-dependent 3-hydroxy-3-methylglutaryl-CoA reductase
MSIHEKRDTVREDVSEGRGFRLSFEVGDTTVRGHALDISHRAIRVAIPEGLPDGLAEDSVLAGAHLTNDQHDVDAHIDLCVIGRAQSTEEGHPVLRLKANDDGTKARLWKLLVQLRGGDLSGGPTARQAPTERPPKIPSRGLYTEEARMERLAFAREKSGAPLDTLSNFNLKAEQLTSNIENLIGSVEVPVGIAGPLQFWGEDVEGPIYVPMATTEGALVASATRGATAITRSGGVTTRVLSQRMMRVPLFVLSDMSGAALFCRWVSEHVNEVREQVSTVSRYAKLMSLEPRMLGNMVHVVFVYETGDAAGQNMTTTCTWKACQWMMSQMKHYDEISFDNFIIEANMSGDKKVNYNSFISGRGTRVLAEAFLSEEMLQAVLKVDSKQLLTSHHGFVAGSIQVGMVGYNINVANVVGAMFTACGQDIACVHESSLAQLHLEGVDGGVYTSMLMPSLIVGTVGGGTHVANQKDLLDLIGCAGAGKSRRLAEIIAGYCLALDLSTLSAIASGQFATAHEKMGRNRPVEWLKAQDLTPAFFTKDLARALGDPKVEVESLEPITGLKMGSSIITELTARKVNKLVGHFPMTMKYKTGDGVSQQADVIAKVKPLDEEVVLMINSMASMCGGKLASNHNKYKNKLGFNGCHTRELGVFAQTDERFTKHMPKVYGVHEDSKREAFVLTMELLKDMVLMDTADDVSGWGKEHIEAAIKGIAEAHSVWYGREDELKEQPWLGPVMTSADMEEMIPLWESLEVHGAEEFPDMVPRRVLQYYLSFVRSLPKWWPQMEAMPRTLIHNDFNPRNVCLRPTDDGLRLCAYDWELATLGLPQHDLAEFLVFVLGKNPKAEDVDHYVELHRVTLEEHSGTKIDPKQWREGYKYALMDLAVNRLALYMMAHTFRHYGFMERIVATARKLVRMEVKID